MVRISGLASGMDIDEMVKSMMQAERIPLDKLTQKKQYAEWQRDDYREINAALLELDQLTLKGVGMQGSYIKKTVSISDPGAISVRNVNSTTDFSGTVNVNKLATTARMNSNGKTTITDSSAKLEDYIGEVIKISAITKEGTMQTTAFEYTIKEGDTLDSVIAEINSNSKSGVTAFYDKDTNMISFTAKNTGDVGDANAPEIDFAGSGSFVTDILKMDANNIQAKVAGRGIEGQNADLVYNGLNITRSSNTFTINGAEITLKKEATGSVTFSSAPDDDAILDTVTQFVNKYNELIEKIKGKTSEAKYRSYQPLTSEQKEAMSEKEIELWEKKAKSGTLRSDSNLNNLLTTMRTSLYTAVSDSSIGALQKIGIATTSNFRDGGKLSIDEDKLRAAIKKNPNDIYELFMKKSDNYKLFQEKGTNKDEQGLAHRLRADLKVAMKNIEVKAGKASSVGNHNFTIGKIIDNLDDRIDRFQDKLIKLESRYYNQFTAMEKAISRANNQSNSLMQYFS